ncbi:hypothetical protein BZG36_01549 [Bifiguratus adelaidae]|uniref:JmjC domain-containing protein n=1 Tax=Bifiguratus adelaidae TaxID=1938954 RepID=A0A261Y425_9FUNG|nr:hypothetical protein BZG36_01549 [Bifiguratus adelaidae]
MPDSFSDVGSSIRSKGCGILNRFEDAFIVTRLLARLNHSELLRLSICSRYLYALCMHDWLWRCLVTAKYAQQYQFPTDFVFGESWLASYLQPPTKQSDAIQSRLRGIESNFLHVAHIRNHINLHYFVPAVLYPPPLPPDHPNPTSFALAHNCVPRRSVNGLCLEDFEAHYSIPNLPVLLTQAGVEQWPAWTEWELSRLSQRYPDSLLRCANERAGPVRYIDITVAQYQQYMKHQNDESPLYIFDPNYGEQLKGIVDDYKVLEYFQRDFLKLLPTESQPPYRWLIIGPQRSGASWHTDPNGTSAWNTLISGRKRWALYPPACTPPGVEKENSTESYQSAAEQRRAQVEAKAKDSEGCSSQASYVKNKKRGYIDESFNYEEDTTYTSLRWYLEVYPHLAASDRPVEVVQEAGETIFVPSGWWHMVLNLEDTVAVTQNFADRGNIHNVLDSLMQDCIRTSAKQQMFKDFLQDVLDQDTTLSTVVNPRREYFASMTEPTDDEFLLGEGCNTRADYEFMLNDPKLWEQRVRAALEMTGNSTCISEASSAMKLQRIASIEPIYRTRQLVVKFFTSWQDGEKHYNIEKEALLRLRERLSEELLQRVQTLMGHGDLREHRERPWKWHWPFIITHHVQGIPFDECPDGSWNSLLKPGSPIDCPETWSHVLDWLAQTVKAIHMPPSSQNPIDTQRRAASEIENFDHYLRWRFNTTLSIQKIWNYFPSRLLEQLVDYLPSNVDDFLSQSYFEDAFILHGDLNPSNIICNPSLNAMTASQQQSDPAPSMLWSPSHIIDFGDAKLNGGDPMFDFVPLFVITCGCRKDLMRQFLLKYGLPASSGPGTASFAKRMMVYCLIWEYPGVSRYIVQLVPDVCAANTWEEVQDMLFGGLV